MRRCCGCGWVWAPPVHGELAIGVEGCHQIHGRTHDDEAAVQNFLVDNGEASTGSRHGCVG